MKRIVAALALGVLGALLLGTSPSLAAPGDEPGPTGFVLPEKIDNSNFGEADRMFLDKVKQAGLWEIPSGEWALRKGLSQRTREVGRLIAADHRVLDDDVKRVAARFGYNLPTQPSPEQQDWLDELDAKTGKAFDEAFAMRLRYAHGVVYGAIASVRAGSRNQLMRDFAKQCEIFVHRHMSLLESTGNVTFDDLPPAVVPKGNLRAAEAKKQPVMLIALFAVTGVIGIAGVTRALRGAV